MHRQIRTVLVLDRKDKNLFNRLHLTLPLQRPDRSGSAAPTVWPTRVQTRADGRDFLRLEVIRVEEIE